MGAGNELPKMCCVMLQASIPGWRPLPVQPEQHNNLIPDVSAYRDLGVIIDSDLKFHDHCTSSEEKAAGVAHNFLKSTRCRSPDFMMHTYLEISLALFLSTHPQCGTVGISRTSRGWKQFRGCGLVTSSGLGRGSMAKGLKNLTFSRCRVVYFARTW